MLNPCGADCASCNYFQKECAGCRQVAGKVFWTQDIGMETCPIYDCSINNKKLENCSSCAQLPCDLFFELKDPERSDEEHKNCIKQRVIALKAL